MARRNSYHAQRRMNGLLVEDLYDIEGENLEDVKDHLAHHWFRYLKDGQTATVQRQDGRGVAHEVTL